MLFYFLCITVFIQLLYHWFFFRKVSYFKVKNKEKSQQHPVSVIVCARDEATNLAKNLPGLLVQTYTSTHEIVVVNHNSQDETRYLLEEFKKTFKDMHIVNLEQEAKGIPGKKYPLSMGIKESRHEIVLLTDADCVPASEFWITKMQDGFDDHIEVVLGYGAYYKRPGALNKMIRFETFHSALQYFSYALSGIPYMGTGRNLSYKKSLFFQNKGFSSINHVPGGDDDLFINQVATRTNTNIVMDKDAFTLSEPKKHFGDYSLTHFLFYPLFVVCCFYFDWRLVCSVFLIRLVSQGIIYYKAMEQLDEKDLFAWYWLFDIWMFFYYFIFAPALWKKTKKSWN